MAEVIADLKPPAKKFFSSKSISVLDIGSSILYEVHVVRLVVLLDDFVFRLEDVDFEVADYLFYMPSRHGFEVDADRLLDLLHAYRLDVRCIR